MTYITAWTSSKFGKIRPQTTELPALERENNLHVFAAVFDEILFILAGNKGIHTLILEVLELVRISAGSHY